MCAPGFSSPDTTLYEGLKLLCSLLVTLVGKGLYGTNDGSSDVRFIDQGTFVWIQLSVSLYTFTPVMTLKRSQVKLASVVKM